MSEIRPSVIGVDLGASFTKVSVRPVWMDNQHGRFFREPCRMLALNGSVLIPTLMIYSAQHERWLAGQEAANYRATPEDRVFANWKRSLYSQQHNQKVDGDMDAATQFFTWLGQRLKETDIGVRESIIKICLPAFDGAEKPAQLLLERMARCGWTGRFHEMISEPKANTIGFFGEGNNAANRYEDGAIHPFYMENFPQEGLVMKHLRNHALINTPRFVTFMILDIGSFTADISICTLDAQRDGDCLRDVKQHSFELGLVEHYDIPLFDRLTADWGIAVDDLTFADKERIKTALNGGNLLQVAVPGRTSISLGSKSDIELSDRIAGEFATMLIDTVRRFSEGTNPRQCFLTGGGASIGVLRDRLVSALEGMGINTLPSAEMSNDYGAELGPTSGTVKWSASGETLERLATALGASSVLLDLPTHEPPEDDSVMFAVEAAWIPCSCNGGNKDCARCAGSGMLSRNHAI